VEKIKILVPIHTLPEDTTTTTMFFQNVLTVLKRKIKVQIIWFVYQPEKIITSIDNSKDYIVLDIHNFNNAVEAVKKSNPDMIYASATWDLMDYAFSSAGKYLNIPVLSEFNTPKLIHRSKAIMLKLYVKRFFSSTVPTDSKKNKPKILKRGRFYLYKFFFLLKTLRAVGNRFLDIFINSMILINHNLNDYKIQFDSRYANTMHLLQSEKLIELLVKHGFDRSTLIVTGSPIFDKSFQQINNWETQSSKKIRILLITASLYEHGFWTRKQRDDAVSKIVKIISKHSNEITLTVKIHPSSESLSEYESIINPIDSSIQVHQKGDVLEFLKSADVVISFVSGNASALIFALISRKPIIICDFYELKDDLFLYSDLAVACRKPTELISKIHEILRDNPASDEKVSEYVKEFLYKADGKAAERISDVMLKLVKK